MNDEGWFVYYLIGAVAYTIMAIVALGIIIIGLLAKDFDALLIHYFIFGCTLLTSIEYAIKCHGIVRALPSKE